MLSRFAVPASCIAVALTAAPLAAQAPDRAAAVAVALELRAGDCTLSEGDEAPFMAATGLGEDALIAVILGAVGDGWILADSETETLSLIPALCDPAGTADMRATLTALMRVNGCRIAEDVADSQFPLFGLTQDMTREAGLAMMAAGEVSESGDDIMLSAALCEGTADSPPTPRGVLLAAMRAGDCTLDEVAAHGALTATGLDRALAAELLRAWEEEGVLTSTGSSETYTASLQLAPALCAQAPSVPYLDPVAQTVAALRGLPDCAATEDVLETMFETMEALLPRAVMEQAETRIEAMLFVGDIVEQGDRISLSAAVCGGAQPVFDSVVAELVDATRANGCSIDEAGAAAIFAQRMDMDVIEAAAELLDQQGRATFGRDTLTLAPDVCAAAPATQPETEPETQPVTVTPADDPVTADPLAGETADSAAFHIDGIMRRNGCILPLADAGALDSRLAAPLGRVLGLTLGADPAVDAGLRDLAVQGLNVLRGAGKVEWSGATGMARLLACP